MQAIPGLVVYKSTGGVFLGGGRGREGVGGCC